MAAVLDGVKVVEVAGWTFVPAGGGALADWGADVIKIEHPETGDPVTDERFATSKDRFINRVVCIAVLREAFAARTLDEWRTRMPALEGAWAVVQTPAEVLGDPQVRANGYVRRVTGKNGETTYDLVANPVQFDETPPELTHAPGAGEHTDEILEKELTLDRDAIVALKLNSTVN